MRFKRLIIENFGPFKERTSIDFKDRDGVSIIWGQNGRGKTTILNAFNFVLNGIVKDRDGNMNDYVSFINEKGKSEGRYSFKITLDLTDKDRSYRVVRSLLPMPGVGEPKTNNDVQVYLMVNGDGNILSDADAKHFVQSIITPNVSRFFLFDGELLTEYEELLNENSPSGGSIKSSIEQILGMPVLTFGAIDAGEAASYIATEARKVAQNEEAVAKYTKMLNSKNDELQGQEDELQHLKNEQEESLIKKKKYQNLANDTEKLRILIGRKDEVLRKMELQEERIKEIKKTLTENLADAWKWMIIPTLEQKNNEDQTAINELTEKERNSKSQAVVISFIQKAIDDIYCPVCNHEVNSDEKCKLEARLDEYKKKTDGLSKEERSRLADLRACVGVYAKYLGIHKKDGDITKQYEAYVTAKVKYSDLKEHDLKEVEEDLDSLKKNASGVDEKKALEYYDKLGKLAAEIALREEGIKEAEGKVESIKSDIKKLNSTIISKSKNKDVALANKRVAFAEAIEAIFTKGIAVYRDKLSKDVEKDATDIFMEMNTEEDYGGLKINDNYGLTIIRKSDGKPVPKRSAGWEHMVAFALIGALHKNAPFDGPVIMDSPFYRLDNVNTASMVRALPLIARQVLMLPYPGEINDATTRMDIGASIVQELEIARISSNESTIKEMSANG